MSRRSQNNGLGGAIVIIILLAGGVMYSQGWSGPVIFNTIAAGIIIIILLSIFYGPIISMFRFIGRLVQRQRLKRIAHTNKPLDAMTWVEFEYFVAAWLKDKGYTNVRITEKYDLGVDIVAKKDGIVWGIQVKHYNGLVGIEAVRQVVVALKKYKCDRAMVVTNSVFSRPATELAKSQDCLLIDGSKL
ncbi:MAG: hypothetical protein UY35_C0010G0021 [Candidatus Saccharibacteria bacterium GW2011_GWC2_48_9]|nr:MAG: hypothetical protein UY35_C0010G0021 [Candidatus Saccharibacteria bacterium GW2011_GWC2_48_9]HCH34026.1 hypothetical protein [Candidatus Saccharibacteria bacterium]